MNIAFAGFRHGHILGLYRLALNDEDVFIKGCFEEDQETKALMEQNQNIEFNYNSYEEMLDDASIEAVAIGDYYQKRGGMVIAALKKGKHVICDKPICTELSELEEIQRLSKANGLQVCCMLSLRYLPQVEKVKEIIESGKLGDIKIISFTGQHCLNFEKRPRWYFEEGKHGGTINDIGIHGLDLLKFLTGKNLTHVDWARTWNGFAEKAPEFKDCAQFSVRMEDIAVMADVSYAAPAFGGTLPTYWSFYIWGTKGMLQFNMMDKKNIHLYRDVEEVIECEGPQSNYLKDFVKQVKGTQTIMNTEDILESQKQILLIQKSADMY